MVHLASPRNGRKEARVSGLIPDAWRMFHSRAVMAWHVGRRMLNSRTLDGRHVRLWFPRELNERVDAPNQLDQWDQATEAASTKIGVEPKSRVNVLMFPTIAETERTFGRRVHGEANVRGHLVVVSADSLEASGHPHETMQHEIAHLLSSYWGELSPPLKCEGLAEWAQGTEGGRDIDLAALTYLLGDTFPPLSRLLGRAQWQADLTRSYTIAGSLTGFLISHFGWDAYRSFFRQANSANFVEVFQGVFGEGLIRVERRWAEALLSRRGEFEPELCRSVIERRVWRAYEDWRLRECIDLVDGAGGRSLANAHSLRTAAWAQMYLGDYPGAVQNLERAAASDDGWALAHRGSLYVELGKCYDLAGLREAAVGAYGKALIVSEAQPSDAATNEEARRYFSDPYTEREWLEEMARWEKG